MGVIIPQVVTSDRASGNQVIDGSLKFDGSKPTYLKRTFSAGNQRTWTWSAWVKRDVFGQRHNLFGAPNTDSNGHYIEFRSTDRFQLEDYAGSLDFIRTLDQVSRDIGWFHWVVVQDTTESTDNNKIKIYKNGVLQTDTSALTHPSTNEEGAISRAAEHRIGVFPINLTEANFDGAMSQVYFIDGQALGPEYFGYTDGLTNTWKPKKYVNTTASPGDVGGVVGFGTNGFYLPFDGSAPIGQDQSGQGNNWTPVNFGGSVSLDSSAVSGARPILNTTPGGTQAGVGAFGSRENVGYAVTVGPKTGGGNAYYIDGVERPTLTGLIRGATYTFDTSDSTVSSTHPFRLSATEAHGTEYTNGVAAITGAATTITIPYDAPESLYYYCTAHSGMGSSITGITTNEKLADQYASDCVLALPLVGNKEDVIASIACTQTNVTVTNNGSIPFEKQYSNYYGGSAFFEDMSSDNLTYTNFGSRFQFPGDYTIEAWIYPTDSDAADGSIFVEYDGSNYFAFNFDPGTQFNVYNNEGSASWSPSTNLPSANKWSHIALVRSGSTQTIYVNGNSIGTNSASGTHGYASPNYARTGGGASSSVDAYIQDVRVYNGVAKYTSDFVVPATSPDILPDTPSGVSGSSKLTKITDGAVSFDGSSDYLSLAHNSDFDMYDSIYTWDLFFYTTDLSSGTDDEGYGTLFSQCTAGSSVSYGLGFDSSGNLSFKYWNGSTSVSTTATTKIVTGKWYHVAVVKDTASATSGNTKIFVDGKLEATTAVSGTFHNSTNPLEIGADRRSGGGSYDYLQGQISNLRAVKGTALYTSNFTPPTAPLTNVTNTKLLCCQSNTSATEGAVKPGTITANGDAVATNFNPFTTDINTVRGQETGYVAWNPLSVRDNVTFSDGNRTLTNSGSGASGWRNVACTQSVTSGKWYVEMHTIGSQNGGLMPGVCKLPNDSATFNPATFSNNFPGMTANSYSLNCFSGSKRTNGSDSSYGSAMAAGDMIMMCLDMDNGAIWWGKNGTWFASGNPATNSNAAFTGLTGEFVFACGISASEKIVTNFGQKPFRFSPPDGFQPLNTANTRPVKVISRPDQYVGITTWTGNSTDDRQINTGFRPDLVWTKRTDSALDHIMWDSVRGASSELYSNQNYAEGTATNKFGEFNDFGFTIKNNSAINQTGDWVSWNWKAGGNKNTFNVDDVGYATAAAAGLTAGDSSSVTGCSIGTKQGFSIVRYSGSDSGQQIPHGLGHTPDLCIIKNVTTDSTNWIVSAGNENGPGGQFSDNVMLLNSTNGNNTGLNGYWNTTNANSTVVYLGGNHSHVNKSSNNYIMYNWINVLGLQKFGIYEGNENTGGDGPFVELGFRPAIIWIKNSEQGTSAADWVIYDSERNKFNPSGKQLYPNRDIAQADDSNHYFDILSNGFKVRSTSTSDLTNATDKYIYCAWAAAPSVDLFGGGANAR